MKIDLDDLERKARAATQEGKWERIAFLRAMLEKGAPGVQRPSSSEPTGLESIIKAAIAFVDEQGKRVDIDRGYTIGLPEDFAAKEFEALVHAVEGAAR